METKISGMLTHSRIPGCFPGRACAAGRATPPTRCLLRWAGRETQEEWEPAPGSVGLSAGAHGRKPGWGGVVLASHWLPRDSSHLPETLARGELGAPSCFWFPCGCCLSTPVHPSVHGPRGHTVRTGTSDPYLLFFVKITNCFL